MRTDPPLSLQVKQQLENTILSGQRKPGQAIPTIRSLAAIYQVHPGTIRSALHLLQEEQLIHLTRRQFLVTDNIDLIHHRRKAKARLLSLRLYRTLSALGCDWEEILNELSQAAQPDGVAHPC